MCKRRACAQWWSANESQLAEKKQKKNRERRKRVNFVASSARCIWRHLSFDSTLNFAEIFFECVCARARECFWLRLLFQVPWAIWPISITYFGIRRCLTSVLRRRDIHAKLRCFGGFNSCTANNPRRRNDSVSPMTTLSLHNKQLINVANH